MNRQLLTVLLLLLLGVSGPWGQGQDPQGPLEDVPKEPPGEEVPKEDGVLVLSNRTLSLALQEHPALLVEFCECQGLSAGDHSNVWGFKPHAVLPLIPQGFHRGPGTGSPGQGWTWWGQV